MGTDATEKPPPPPPCTADDPAMKAAARAYALSGSTRQGGKKKNASAAAAAAAASNAVGTTSAISWTRRPAAVPPPPAAGVAAGVAGLAAVGATAYAVFPTKGRGRPHVPPLVVEPAPFVDAHTRSTAESFPRPAGAESVAVAVAESLPATSPDTLSDAEGDLDDYARFVKSLGLDDDWKLRDDDDEEEYLIDAMENDSEDDDDDDDGGGGNDDSGGRGGPSTTVHHTQTQTTKLTTASSAIALDLLEWDPNFYRELEEELGGLEEEDMEAAVATLLDHAKKKPDGEDTPAAPVTANATDSHKTDTSKISKSTASTNGEQQDGPSPNTPLRDAARASRTIVTAEQMDEFQNLMDQHYQLLIQQAVLATRGAHYNRTHRTHTTLGDANRSPFATGTETADDLVEILDGAVGMLQDLDQNRKDAIRNSIQLETAYTPARRRSLLSEMDATEEASSIGEPSPVTTGGGRLTRAQFSKKLEKHPNGQQRTVFDVQGLGKLKETFAMLDKSVEGGVVGNGSQNILELESNSKACQQVLDEAGAEYDKSALPDGLDPSENFCDAKEFLGDAFKPPCTHEHEMVLRRNRNLFTSGEDNLVLRGVNLYGEKQWGLIADRYLPDRSVNIISQRYSKLCVMLYKAHGIDIDTEGNMNQPPKLESVDDLDETKVATLKQCTPPAILNVHRWSLEEDLTLLRAVPIMGHMWAEIGARLLPHRDRGHLRKRYQVLERRVKASVSRTNRHETSYQLKAKYGKSPQRQSPAKALSMPNWNPIAPSVGAKSIGQAAAILATARMAPPAPHLSHYSPVAGHYPMHASGGRPPIAQGRNPIVTGPITLAPRPSRPDPQGSDGSSRHAFEQLVKETDGDWSQMSRMQKMMENDTESMVANAIVSQLAKSPFKPSGGQRTFTAGAPGDKNDDEGSGFSMLDSYGPSPAKEPIGEGVSFLAGVLERTREAQGISDSREPAAVVPSSRPPLSRATTATKKSPPATRKPKEPPRALPPSTPNSSTIFTTTGTPIGLSSGFVLPTSAFKSDGSPSLSVDSFPSRAAAEIITNSQNSSDGNSMLGYNLTGLFESQTPEAFKSTSSRPSPAKTPTCRPLFGEDATLMENDLEAISALSQMSHSPALKRPASSQDGPQHADETATGADGNTKSLFAKVVGGVAEKESRKKRLKF